MTVKRGATLPFDEAERALSGGWETMPPLVLAAGPDEYLRSRLVAAFRAGGESEGAELERLDAEALTAETLAGALASLSLFSSSRRLWIREGSKLDKECEDALVAWTRGGAEATRLLVTTAREIAELRGLQALSAAGASVACALRPGEAVRWVDRMLAEAGLVLPPGAGAALAEHAKDLLEARQEIEKLRLYAEPSGKVPAAALAALRGARAGGSLDRWADAVLARDARAARREAAALDAEGVGGTEPQAFAYRRGAAPRVTLPPSAARAALHAVYAADRALKRGEARDAELRDLIARMLLSPGRASHDA